MILVIPLNQPSLNVVDPLHESDYEDEELNIGEEKSAEDIFAAHDEILQGYAALLEYANTHANPTRNRLIIRLVIFEGRSYPEVAEAVGCNVPVIGYVVREAQR